MQRLVYQSDWHGKRSCVSSPNVTTDALRSPLIRVDLQPLDCRRRTCPGKAETMATDPANTRALATIPTVVIGSSMCHLINHLWYSQKAYKVLHVLPHKSTIKVWTSCQIYHHNFAMVTQIYFASLDLANNPLKLQQSGQCFHSHADNQLNLWCLYISIRH